MRTLLPLFPPLPPTLLLFFLQSASHIASSPKVSAKVKKDNIKYAAWAATQINRAYKVSHKLLLRSCEISLTAFFFLLPLSSTQRRFYSFLHPDSGNHQSCSSVVFLGVGAQYSDSLKTPSFAYDTKCIHSQLTCKCMAGFDCCLQLTQNCKNNLQVFQSVWVHLLLMCWLKATTSAKTSRHKLVSDTSHKQSFREKMNWTLADFSI